MKDKDHYSEDNDGDDSKNEFDISPTSISMDLDIDTYSDESEIDYDELNYEGLSNEEEENDQDGHDKINKLSFGKSIIPFEEPNSSQISWNKSAKFKCPLNSKNKKIRQEDVKINQRIMNCIKVNSRQIFDTNQIFCKRCSAIDSESSHISNQFISHKEYSEPLSQDSFKSLKEYNYSLSQSDIEYIPK